MGSLSDEFTKAVHAIGMKELKHPIFYNSPIGIRFQIGGDESVYLDNMRSKKYIQNPAYITAAFDRVKTIYTNLPNKPDILRIDCYPDKSSAQDEIQTICKLGNLPLPHEQVVKSYRCDKDDEIAPQIEMFWDLEKIPFIPDKLIHETIKADIGGYYKLASSIYYLDTRDFTLFHLYDYRGADLVAADKESLRPIYEKLNSWILEYDRKKIDAIFIR